MSRPIRHVVLGFDFSANARAALAAAQHLVTRLNSQLHVVTAAEGAVDDTVVEAVEKAGAAKLRADFLKRVEEYVRAEVTSAVGPSARVTYHVGLSSPAQAILAATAEQQADLVLVGAIGNRPPAEAYQIGVDAQRLARHGSAPLLIVRDGVPFPPRRVLCAVDFSLAAAQALEVAVDLARLGGCLVDILHVMPAPSTSELGGLVPAYPAEYRRGMHTIARREMTEFLAHIDTSGVVTRVEIAEGVPAAFITARVLEGGYDLLALGTVGRAEVAQLTIGGTAERIIRAAQGNVLAVRPRRETTDAEAFWGGATPKTK
jgi:nucleotide-binding universal stress UspA family protein